MVTRRKPKEYVKLVAIPFEVREVDKEWVLLWKGKLIKKLLAQSEDGRDRESIIRINEFENEL